MAAFWTEVETDRLIQMYQDGKQWTEISQTLERNADSCRGKLKGLIASGRTALRKHGNVPIPAEQFESFKAAGESATIEQLRNQIAATENPERVPVQSNAPPRPTPDQLWKHWETENAKRIEFAHEQSKFHVSFNHHKPIGVSFISDQHISGNNTVDLARMRADAELIKNTPGLYAILGGDGVDNHIKIPPAILAARSQPDDQWRMYDYYLQIFAEKILAVISGNHDAWTDQRAGVDMVRLLTDRHKLAYSPHGAHLDITVDQQVYRVEFRHQYRFNSAYNQGHSAKQLWRFGERDFDIGCICHLHEAHAETFRAHGVKRWICRPGSYQISSSYSHQYGFNDATPTCPTFIIFPGERRIIGFDDVRDAVKTLAAERA